MQIKDKKQEIIINTAYSMGGLILMNAVLQLLIYPLLTSRLGTFKMGELLFIMGLTAIFCPSIGQALNNSHLVLRRKDRVVNGDYNRILVFYSLLAGLLTLFLSYREGYRGIFFSIEILALILFTSFRYYLDIEYRISLNYRGYFIYYGILSMGYILGFALYLISRQWMFVFLLGEAAAFFYIVFGASLLKKPLLCSPYLKKAFFRGSLLIFSYLITNFTLNLDRLALKYLLGNVYVTRYYVVSLIGKTMVLIIVPINTIVISYLSKSQKELTKKSFLKFVGAGLVSALAFFILCQIAAPLFIGIFYHHLYKEISPYIWTVNIVQILSLLSAFLFIVVLTFISEKWQLLLQLCHLILLLVLVLWLTGEWGLRGFIYANLAANAARVLAVIVLGLIKLKKEADR